MNSQTRLLMNSANPWKEETFQDAFAMVTLAAKGDEIGLRAVWADYAGDPAKLRELCNVYGSCLLTLLTATFAMSPEHDLEDLLDRFVLAVAGGQLNPFG